MCLNGICRPAGPYAWDPVAHRYDICGPDCASCIIPGDIAACLSCVDPSMFPVDGICACDTGFARDQYGICQACDPSCTTCVQPANPAACTGCTDPLMTLINGVCFCPGGTAFNPVNGTCEPCDPSCGTCAVPGDRRFCTSCAVGRLVSGLCVLNLYPRCHPTCATCLAPNNPNMCTSCRKGSVLVGGMCIFLKKTKLKYPKKCKSTACHLMWVNNVCKCKSGFRGDSDCPTISDRYCLPCHPTCLTCHTPGDPNACTSCCKGYTLVNGTCVCSCPGQAVNPITGICERCAPGCATCILPGNSAACLTCRDPNALFANGVCYCPPGFALDQYGMCTVPCLAPCIECLTTNASLCTACPGDLVSVQGVCVCPNGTAFLNDTNTCAPCDPSCLTCGLALDPLACTSCADPNATLVNGQCVCPLGTELNFTNGLCVTCPPGCLGCALPGVNCTLCFDPIATLCDGLCICPPGFIMVNGTCAACDPTCATCTAPADPNACTQCADPVAALIGSPGPCRCPVNMTMAANGLCTCDGILLCPGVCVSCPGPCLSCIPVNGNLVCTTCAPGSILVGNTCVCVPPLVLSENGTCEPCHPSCATCFEPFNASACLTCSDPTATLINGECVCPAGTFFNSVSCAACDITCLTCEGNATNCTTCRDDDAIPTPAGCVCPIGFSMNSIGLCVACSPECATCIPTAPTLCLSCRDPNATYNETTFTCTCPPGFQMNSTGSCVTCHPTCNGCIVPNDPNSCLACRDTVGAVYNPATMSCSCINPFHTFTASGFCAECDPICLTCDVAQDPTGCTSCPPGLNFTDGACVCPDGTFYNETAEECQPCSPTCLTCNGTATFCTSCAPPATLFCNTCVCPSGLFINGTCGVCDTSCATCAAEYNPSNCTSCRDPTAILTSNPGCCICQNQREALNITGFCAPCHYSCASCSMAGEPGACTSCDPSAIFSNGFCICPIGFMMNATGQCVACDPACTTCTVPANPNFCTSCFDPLATLVTNQVRIVCTNPFPTNCSLVNTTFGTCVCPNNTAPLPDGSCPLGCHFTCATCSAPNDPTACLSCKSGAVLNPVTGTCDCLPGGIREPDGSCIVLTPPVCTPPCPPGFYCNNATLSCLPCLSPCVTCTSATNCTSCLPGYALSPAGVCIPCPPTCTSCATNGNGGLICTSCAPGYILVNGACVRCPTAISFCSRVVNCACQQCAPGYYLADPVTCLPCPANLTNCLQCLNATYCLACRAPYLLDTISRKCKCPQAKCSQCMSNYQYCLKCKDGYYYGPDHQCKPCYSTCGICNEYGQDKCMTCPLGASMRRKAGCNTGECYCPPGYTITKRKQGCVRMGY